MIGLTFTWSRSFCPLTIALVLSNLSVTVHFIFIFKIWNIRNWQEKQQLNGLYCGKRLLQNKSSKCIYPGTTSPVSKFNQDTIQTATIQWNINATTTGPNLVSYRCQYVHIAINWALNATQGHKRSRQTSY